MSKTKEFTKDEIKENLKTWGKSQTRPREEIYEDWDRAKSDSRSKVVNRGVRNISWAEDDPTRDKPKSCSLGIDSWGTVANNCGIGLGRFQPGNDCAKGEYYQCRQCAVITNSNFTRNAVELATNVACRLIGESELDSLTHGTIYPRQRLGELICRRVFSLV